MVNTSPQSLYDHVARLVDLGKYDQNILQDYTKAELDELDSYIDHKRDLDFSYAAVKQLDSVNTLSKTVFQVRYTKVLSFYIFCGGVFVCKLPTRNKT